MHHGGRFGRWGWTGPFWGSLWWGWGCPYSYVNCYAPGYGLVDESGESEWTTVDIEVSVMEARVYLEGRDIGSVGDFDGDPDFLYLRPGAYKLEFRCEGYKPLTVYLEAQPGAQIEIDEKLEEESGARRRDRDEKTPPEGRVLRYWGDRDGVPEAYDREGSPPRMMSESPDSDDRPDEDSGPMSSSGQPGDDEREPNAPPAAQPAQRSARILFSVQPADAAIYVDDNFVAIAEEVGQAFAGVPVTAGKHSITVTRPGFKDQTVEMEVALGEAKSVNVSLEK